MKLLEGKVAGVSYSSSRNLTYVLPKTEIDRYTEFVGSLKASELEPGWKVVFHESAVFPRRKFTEYHTQNKIVKDIKNADAIIVDLAAIKHAAKYMFYHAEYLKHSETEYSYRTNNYLNGVLVINNQLTEELSTQHNCKERMNEVNKLIQLLDGKKLIDSKSLKFNTEEKLTQSAYEVIDRLFNGGNDMINMAMRMLTAFSYDEEKHKIAMILHRHWEKWRSNSDKKVSIEIKSMIRKLDVDYPGWQYTGRETAYWFKLALEYPEDEAVQYAFNQWVAEQTGEKDKNYKLITI